MAQHITTTAATTIGSNTQAIFIQVNAALTGSITIATGGSTQYGTSSATVAVITNPTVGSQFKYGGLAQQGPVTVTASGTCDITVTSIDHLN